MPQTWVEWKWLMVVASLLLLFKIGVAAGQAGNDVGDKNLEPIEEIEEIQKVQEIAPTIGLQALWPIHGLLTGFATLLLLVSVFIARRRNRDKFWLAKHQTLGVVSPLILLIGFFVAFYMIQLFHAAHFDIPHPWAGAGVIGGVIIMPFLGFFMLRSANSGRKLRRIHVWLGRIIVLAMIGVVFSGIFTAYGL